MRPLQLLILFQAAQNSAGIQTLLDVRRPHPYYDLIEARLISLP